MKQENLPNGYAKTVAQRVQKNYNVYCTPCMVYKTTSGGFKRPNAYIILELEKLRNEHLEVQQKIKEAIELQKKILNVPLQAIETTKEARKQLEMLE